MDVFKTFKPNEAGTKRFVKQYGDKLVAVRYRKGTKPNNIYTTVEIIVDTKSYEPGISHTPVQSAKSIEQVPLSIGYEEVDLRQILKSAGARWDAKERRWYLSYKKVCDLKLKDRILKPINT